ncbi:MAG TPA: adenosine deaminase [Anaerolineae bacterium]|nr:adenosine deaminase [Anaerolineae bacterium]HQI84854.1 adenosine deaminase [Anaerolineae bacterium]
MNWFERIPKVELHLHLEGAIPHAALWELVQKYGGDPSLPDLAALQQRFVFRDFPHFIEMWVWKNQFLREYEDFTFIAEAVARDLANQNIRYAEVFYSPIDFARHGLHVQPLTEAIRAGLARVPEIDVALITDFDRGFGAENAARTLAEVCEVRDLGIVGVGLGGLELQYPPELFTEVYAQARELGFHTTAHAGEAAGAASIWGALRALRIERIGHGVHAEEDPALLDYLAEHTIPLEMCPLSNVRTGVVQSLDKHPARRYFERGILVTISTDDPKMFGNTLAEEYALLEQTLGFSRADIRTLILNGIRAAWLPETQKERLRAAFCADPVWQMDDIAET